MCADWIRIVADYDADDCLDEDDEGEKEEDEAKEDESKTIFFF